MLYFNITCGSIESYRKSFAYFCKFEELLFGKSLDKIEELDANQPEIYRVAAKLFAKLHTVTEEELPRKMDYCYRSWPWNTR